MSRISITLGIILIVVGGLAYAITAFASWTALIPAFLGVLFVACGLIGFLNATIGAVLGIVLAVLGLVGTGMNVVELGAVFTGEAERPAAVITSTIAFLLLIAYVIVMVRMLVVKRRESLRLPA